MISDPLQQFLQQQSEQGDVESEGAFTVTQDKAIQKLSKLTLNDSSEWVLKMVQTAVAGECEALHFVQSKEGTTVDFVGLTPPNLEDLSSLLLSPEPGQDPVLSELVIGLRTLLFEAPFVVSANGQDSIFWDGNQLTNCETEESPGDLRVWRVRRGWSLAAARRSQEEKQQLIERALAAPLKLTMDRRPLTVNSCLGIALSKRETFGFEHSFALLTAAFEPTTSAAALKCSLREKWVRPYADKLRLAGFFLTGDEPQVRTRATHHYYLWARCADYPGAEHRPATREMISGTFKLQYTRLGVVCAERTSSSEIQGSLFVPVTGAKSDLSGLRIEVPDLKGSTDHRVLDQVEALNSALLELLGNLKSTAHRDWTDVKRGLIGTGSGATAVAWSTWILNSIKAVVALKVGLAAGLVVGGLTFFAGTKSSTESQKTEFLTSLRLFSRSMRISYFFERPWKTTKSGF